MDPITEKLLRRLLRALERIETQRPVCPLQKTEEGVSATESSHTQRGHPTPNIVVRAITQLGDSDARYRNAQGASEHRSHKKALTVQWLLFVATLAAFGAASYYAHVAVQQRDIMSEQLRDEERAILLVDGDPFRLEGDQARLAIRYRNKGRKAAILQTSTVVFRRVANGQVSEWDGVAYPNRAIGVEDLYFLGVPMPEKPLMFTPSGEQQTGPQVWSARLSVTLKYDDGFGGSQTVKSCFAYHPRPKIWAATCMSVDQIQLTKDPSPE